MATTRRTAKTSTPKRKTLKMAVDKKGLAQAEALARKARLDLQVVAEPQLVDPITAVVIGGGAVLVFKLAVDLVDKLRGGVYIDLRPRAKYLIRRDRSVPVGWVVILAADGKSVKIETQDAPKDAAERLLTKIVEGTLSSAASIAKEAKKALGEGKVEEDAL
jgi:hypothetical protein